MILDPTTGLTFTFSELVGGSMAPHPSSDCVSATAEPTQAGATRSYGRLMRIYLPDGAAREMTLTDYREFLVSYRFTDTAGDAAAEDTSLCGEAEEGSRSVCGEAAGF